MSAPTDETTRTGGRETLRALGHALFCAVIPPIGWTLLTVPYMGAVFVLPVLALVAAGLVAAKRGVALGRSAQNETLGHWLAGGLAISICGAYYLCAVVALLAAVVGIGWVLWNAR